ncbi:YlxR family protein [Nocardioides sp. KIGAM211]|uniref:YlxR family protein n=1 Tax=Nocardioides luti TaxID=2761101 RepID=A0A7X0RDU4_9ACTN|nr:YlxR family protein [Nocardioides luti]
MARQHVSSACPDSAAPTGPVRTCVGCRKRAAKCELLRIVAGSDTEGLAAVVPDPDGTAGGRGAHLHPTTDCFELAVRRRAFSRALRTSGSGSGLSLTPLEDHLHSHAPDPRTTDRDWSSSS